MCPIQGAYVSADIPFNADAETVRVTLQNLPNVDYLDVVRTTVSGPNNLYKWAITFTSQVRFLLHGCGVVWCGWWWWVVSVVTILVVGHAPHIH
jgi:hypothetical protein